MAFFPVGATDFSPFQNVLAVCGAHRASCAVGSASSYAGANGWGLEWSCTSISPYACMKCTATCLYVCIDGDMRAVEVQFQLVLTSALDARKVSVTLRPLYPVFTYH